LLTFPDDCSFDPSANVITFPADRGGERILCRLSLEALHDQVGLQGEETTAVLTAFSEARDVAEEIAIHKYENGLIEPDGSVLVRAADF